MRPKPGLCRAGQSGQTYLWSGGRPDEGAILMNRYNLFAILIILIVLLLFVVFSIMTNAQESGSVIAMPCCS